MRESFEGATVGEIVAGDCRAAAIFEKYGIDFCCGGRRSLAEACREAVVDPTTVAAALAALPPPSDSETDPARWPLDRLIDHIVETHHAYIRDALPTITRHLDKVVQGHGTRYPELSQVKASFARIGRDLLQHMMKEEHVLFPYIRELASRNGGTPVQSPFGSVENPIRMMEREHRDAGDEMQELRALTNGFVPPPSGCSTYRVTFQELAQFERDLHRHVHLENNVLFPAAIELEQRACRASH